MGPRSHCNSESTTNRQSRRLFDRRYRGRTERALVFAAAAAALLSSLSGASSAFAASGASARTETLVFVRHGEKPAGGYGQLDCQGLNRALALPAVVAAKFGKPNAIYAPNPSIRKEDAGVRYDYVRPLATIEPTAIQFGLPVDTTYGYAQIDALKQELVKPEQAGKLIVAAWEHHEIEDLVQEIVTQYGDAGQKVPHWRSGDFDSIYVVKLDWDPQSTMPHATFSLDREGLDGRSADCPCAALPDAAPAAAR
ncbi:histidine phosphatase family protein [Trinickia sp. NRRL B-1857]|uniref:histidine phosphatase family protein n=1 Tax=Trinickia sp. NRRL B-1857 TaxID=3162879 RepID=UPI003D2C0C39